MRNTFAQYLCRGGSRIGRRQFADRPTASSNISAKFVFALLFLLPLLSSDGKRSLTARISLDDKVRAADLTRCQDQSTARRSAELVDRRALLVESLRSSGNGLPAVTRQSATEIMKHGIDHVNLGFEKPPIFYSPSSGVDGAVPGGTFSATRLSNRAARDAFMSDGEGTLFEAAAFRVAFQNCTRDDYQEQWAHRQEQLQELRDTVAELRSGELRALLLRLCGPLCARFQRGVAMLSSSDQNAETCDR